MGWVTLSITPQDTAPDDWHIHLRDGDALALTVAHAADNFGRAIVMPNLVPPVRTVADVIAETDWSEPFAPALHAAPGQTVYRTGYSFEGISFLGLRGDAPGSELIENVFAELESCQIVEEPKLTASASNPHLAPDLIELIDVTCAELDPGGYFLADEAISAPEDEDLWVDIGVEFVDADGNRQGMGGSREGPARLAAGETTTRVGDSVAYTINDPTAVTDCRLHSARRLP